jgi:DHA2 family multidrug resistance protein-like MFS transporter
VGTAPPERAGAASAIQETSSEFGGALGIAMLGSLIVAVYRRAMAESALEGVPPAVAEAARTSLGVAADAAAALPGPAGAALLEASREAFAQAFVLTASISAAVALAAALLALFMLRHVAGPPRAAPATPPRPCV